MIPYIVALIVMGLPLMWVEWTLGRYGGQFGHHSAPGILQSTARGRGWKYFGVFGIWANLIIAAFYVYIESWCLAYAGFSAIGGFRDTPAKEFYNNLIGASENNIFSISIWGMGVFAVCIVLNVFILSRGLARGIETVAKIGMPILILFAAILAVRGLMSQVGDEGVVESPFVGLNFVWEPKLDSLANPAVWLAAAGQIFFTLSIGIGSIHCYSSYLRAKDDIALTGATTAWTNEFCEVVLGGTVLIPIAVAYLGLSHVADPETSGFALGFLSFPTLFQKWGWLAAPAGFLWFGLLFVAAITSSLAMGQPIMAFLQDEYGFDRKRSALAFGGMLLLLAVPVAIFEQKSFFDEFDFWGGTFALVVFAFGESILFGWVFGMDKAWAEMNRGAELKIPSIFYYFIKYLTPVFLFFILAGSIFQPKAGWDAYSNALFKGEEMPAWEWSGSGVIGKILHKDIEDSSDPQKQAFNEDLKLVRTIDRLVLVGVFLFFSVLVYFAWKRRAAEGRLAT